MGVVPLPPPSWMTRDELIEYRDHLERQRQGLTWATFRRTAFPSEDFLIALAILSPWIVSVALKLWIGDWRI